MTLSNIVLAPGEASVSSGVGVDVSTVALPPANQTDNAATPVTPTTTTKSGTSGQLVKRKRNLPGTPDPDAEVIALSPKTLMATNRFVCEICNKGFQRDQNLQLHRRGHNLPWKLRQRTSKEIRKRVYICPEAACVHHDPSRALGDLTGIKKHFCRKHGEKKWKCDKCSKRYAVQSDWKAHSKTCGTREYRCDCGTLFSRRDSFITHRAFCDALAEESARVSASKPGQTPVGDQTLGGSPSAGSVSVIGAPSSPRSANMSMRGGQIDSMAVSAPPRPGIGGNLPPMGMSDGGLPMLPSRWVQPGGPGAGSTTPGSGTRLSLWSGSGPGPGPPPGLMEGSQLNLGGISQVNPIDPSSQFLMQPPKMQQPGSGVSHVMGGSSDFDIPQAPMPSAGLRQMPRSAGHMYANLLGSGNGLPGMQGSSGSGQGAGNLGMGGMISAGFADFGSGTPNRFERGNAGAQGLSLSSAAGMTSSPSSANNGAGSTSTVPTILNQQQHTASAQMSATALLQKAAQMGVSTSKTSFLRNYGMGGGPGGGGQGSHGGGGIENSSLGIWQGQGQGPNRQDQGRAASLPPISSVMSGLHNNVLRRPGDRSTGSQGMGSPSHSAGFGGGQGRQGDHQDYMNSLTHFTGNIPPMYPVTMSGGSGNLGSIIPPGSPMQHRLQQGNDNMGSQSQQHHHQQKQHNLHQHHGGSQVQQGIPPTMLPGLGKTEDGRDRLTRDFLGVGATASMPGRAFSQRDFQVAGIAPIGQGGVDINFNNRQRSGRSGQLSPGKSWDGS